MNSHSIDPGSGLPPTKTVVIRTHIAAGDWHRAIAMAARLPCLGAHRNVILTAQGAITNPNFYVQIGRDPASLIEAGKLALRDRFGHDPRRR
jgi:hypothetical protein